MTPLFIIGSPRSGTSLLRLMLTCHKNIIIPPESHFFLWLEDKYGNWRQENGFDDFLEDLFNSTKFETWGINRSELKNYLKKQSISSYSDIIKSIYVFYGLINNKSDIQYWGDKNKLWKEKLELIPEYFPNTKFVHIIRDGRDVACSFIELKHKQLTTKYAPKLPHEIEEIAERWNVNINAIDSFLNGVNREEVLELRYEDLVNDTESELSKIMKFLNLPFDPAMLNYHKINKVVGYEPKIFMSWKNKLNQKPDSKNIGKYSEILTKDQIEIFEKKTLNILTRYGYK
jgi:hypothetical protein